MPFGDMTGPLGQGPRTGRGAGYCSGYGMPGYANPYIGGRRFLGRGFFGRGRGFGRGWFGRGRARWSQFGGYPYPEHYPPYPSYPVELSKKEERKVLEEEAKTLKEELKEIETRLEKVEVKKK